MTAAPGTPTVSTAAAAYTDFVHTGPGTLAGRYLRTFWHPVYLAAELPAGRAVPVRIMSEDFTLYRGEGGQPHAVAFRCAHRGTQLSTGWVEGDCIRCFYHGWKYDPTGQCVEMPAEDPSFPPRVRIRAYPTAEYLGLIFVYLGEGEPPPLPRYPDFEQDGVLLTSSYVRHCNYFQNIENGLDPVHTAFAHRESRGTFVGLEGVPRMTGEESPWGITMYGTRPNGKVRVNQFGMPNVLHIMLPAGTREAGWMDALAWRVPVDDETHRSFNVNLVHVRGEAAERYRAWLASQPPYTGPSAVELGDAVLRGELRVDDIEDRSVIVNVQDYVAQVGQGRIQDRRQERLGRSDVLVILLRRIWARELRAFAEGRPLTAWTRPPGLVATSGAADA
ncbi:MAG TPA: aromatic ring-hydroxylating dioxygenase subunit alpha [Chloroflexota bacterium]|nr:aromatic ring-hydroxylating dioxygenase subunit alpha [Chloroflexota bacterium]